MNKQEVAPADAVGVVQALAESDPAGWDEYGRQVCAHCGGAHRPSRASFAHEEDCLYVRALRLVGARA